MRFTNSSTRSILFGIVTRSLPLVFVLLLLLTSHTVFSQDLRAPSALREAAFTDLTLEISSPNQAVLRLQPIPLVIRQTNRENEAVLGYHSVPFRSLFALYVRKGTEPAVRIEPTGPGGSGDAAEERWLRQFRERLPDAPLPVRSTVGDDIVLQWTDDLVAVALPTTLQVGYQVTDNLRAFVGYNFVWLSSVARPGDQVDLTVNPAAFGAPPGAAVVPARPAGGVNPTDFYVNALSFGMGYTW